MAGLGSGGGSACRGLAWCSLHRGDTAARGSFEPEEKMFGFHEPKMYRSTEGCCTCRAKSSSSRFTDSKQKRTSRAVLGCMRLVRRHLQRLCAACEKMDEVAGRIKSKQTNEQTNKQTKTNLESRGRCKSRPQSKDNIETKESENSIWKQDEKQPEQ